MRKAVWMIGVLALTLVVGGYVFFGGERKAPVRYRTATVERGLLESMVTATGTINPVVSVQVGAQVTGKIQSLHADFNSAVKAGDLVATIDPSVYQARRDQAAATLANTKAVVAKSQADLAQRKRELVRINSLLGQQFVSQNDVDVAVTTMQGAQAQLEVSEAQVKQAKAQLDAADLDLKYAVIRSPVSGIVIARNVEVGQTVTAGFQTPTLFLIALDLTKMQVDTNVSEADIGGIAEGKEAAFSVDAYPGESFRGMVKQVRNAPISVQNVVAYDVVIEVDNRDLRLKPGMTANVSIVVARKEDALKVPNAALRFSPPQSGHREAASSARQAGSSEGPATAAAPKKTSTPGQKRVWREGASGDPEALSLQTGISDGTFTEIITEALREGEPVIVGIETTRSGSRSDALPPGFGGGGQHRPRSRDRGL
ncbi:MAG: efflux RND transporter periplasmic adaptor subunit [Nitrospira sp.]|nr:MAG: efflux RND transporter periplasmic adaptor subunit [Nitrospira sp.]